MPLGLIQSVLVSLALGLLVGLQREWSKSPLAGIRTFPLITVLGTVIVVIGGESAPFSIGAGLLAVAAMLAVGNLGLQKTDKGDGGLTTEFASLVMFGVGALVGFERYGPAMVITGAVAVLLQWKGELHRFVEQLDEAELRSGARLVLIALVILPALPDEGYGPYGVLNPYRMWLMVVLIVGISLAAYVGYRVLGARTATLTAGIFGGLVSSTATTVTYAQRAKQTRALTATAGRVILMASAVVFLRVLLEISVVAPASVTQTAPPLLAMMALMVALAWVGHASGEADAGAHLQPPSAIRGAVIFGLLYGVVLLAVAVGREYLGERGLYAIAALSGLTDVDAITLSTMQMVTAGSIEQDLGWRLILVGVMSNVVFKGGIVAVLGTRYLLRKVAPLMGLALMGGAAILLFWP